MSDNNQTDLWSPPPAVVDLGCGLVVLGCGVAIIGPAVALAIWLIRLAVD